MRTSALAAAMLLTACWAGHDRPIADIPRLGSLAEVMAFQAAVADPAFEKIGQPSYDARDDAALGEVASKIQASSLAIQRFSMGSDFDALALQLHTEARALGEAVARKDAPAVSKALGAMKKTCRQCHGSFR